MTTGELTPVLRYLRQVGGATAEAGLSDRQLLERFVRRRDGASFEALVRRHGPMVHGVCRRVLRDAHEAEDAFQATFLVLVRKAGALRQPELLGPWLHAVARRTAVRARARAARRQSWDPQVEDLPAPADEDLLWRDLRPVLDAAIERLPPKYRVPFVLCYLEGMTNAQAAQHLGCPAGTVATRLARARERLRARLTRQGIAVGGGLLGLLLATRAATAVPPALVAGTVRAFGAGVLPATVTTLMEGVCKAMLMDKVRMLFLALAALVAVGGAGLWTYRALAGEPPAAREEQQRFIPAPTEPAGPPPLAPAPAVVPPVVEDVPLSASYRTANFVVTANSRRCAQLVAEAAERQRRVQAVRWLGRELPDWPAACRVQVNIPSLRLTGVDLKGDGHFTSFQFERGRVLAQQMCLEGSLERILANQLPHEVTHTILADHFRGSVPRWADEGAAVLAEDEEEHERHDQLMRLLLDTPDRFIPLARLLPMPDYPKEVLSLYAEGYALTRFLVERKDRPTFLKFVALGMRDDWDTAAWAHYGFRNVMELQQAWLASLKRERGREANAAAEPPQLGSAPPVTGMALVDGKGRLVLHLLLRAVVVRPVQGRFRYEHSEVAMTTYVRETMVEQRLIDVDAAEVYDLDGKRVEPKAIVDALSRETAVLVSTDGRKVDPYHLQLIKKGTLIVVAPPVPAPTAPPVPILPAPPAAPGN